MGEADGTGAGRRAGGGAAHCGGGLGWGRRAGLGPGGMGMGIERDLSGRGWMGRS